MSEWRDGEGYEAGKEDFGIPGEAAGCVFEGCLTFALPCLLIGLFVFVR